MDKQKQIEEMAKELHCATNESLISCRKIARILVEKRGYGNVKEALAEFAEMLKKRLCDGVFGDEDIYTEGKWYTPKYVICEEIDNMKESILK